MTSEAFLCTNGSRVIDGRGTTVVLRGVGLGGWLNMENFITGYPATETLMREAVGGVLGAERAALFFDRLLSAFFAEPDADFLAELGFNCLRLPVNYRHLESDDRPLQIIETGFDRIDRAIELCAARGIYTVIDLHALPGCQNQGWHSDNPTRVAGLWRDRAFQDRGVHLWERIADRYRDQPWVAGYNLINEPADPTGAVIGPFCARLVAAVRAVDPRHMLFLDGNRYATDFSMFAEPYENTIYACHDYALAGFARGGDYPGYTDGHWVDRDRLEQTFLQRTEFQRRTDTPLWVGEFGPVYTGEPGRDDMRYQIVTDQLEIYREYGAGWSIWTYKDVGLQGLVHADPDGAYRRRFRALIDKKARLGVDEWGSTGDELAAVLEPLHALIANEFPLWLADPANARRATDDIVRDILVAPALLAEYAQHFDGLTDDELVALADSFAFDRCLKRTRLCDLLRAHAQRGSGAIGEPVHGE
jgi:aryl-phospho-beta-D-glucosidase BglC (GH1 family)